MPEKKGFVSQGSADRALREVVFNDECRKRARRKKRNRLFNQATYESLPRATVKRLIRELTDLEHNKKRIARENGLSHAFIVWLWEHHV